MAQRIEPAARVYAEALYGAARDAGRTREVDRDFRSLLEELSSNRPLLRLCSVGNKASLKPLEDRSLTWSVCTPQTAKSFSGVAYHFGREVSDLEKVPVGLIGAYVSGTPAQSWANVEALESSPKLKGVIMRALNVLFRSGWRGKLTR